MSFAWACRVTLGRDPCWIKAMPSDIVVKVVYVETASRDHQHILIQCPFPYTDHYTSKLNKALREATGLYGRNDVSSGAVKGTVDQYIAYIKKDGDPLYIAPDYKDRVDSVEAAPSKKEEKKEEKEEAPVKEKKPKWTLYTWMYETARAMLDDKVQAHFERERPVSGDISRRFYEDYYRSSIRQFAIHLNQYIFEIKKDHWAEPFKVANVHGYNGYIQTIHARLFYTADIFNLTLPPSWT